MPNGDPQFSEKTLPGLEAFFARLAPLLEAFASRHNLKVEKYYHESHSWSLQFRHPRGGVAKIDVERHSADTVRIWACWWHDDYEKATRSIKRFQTEPLEINAPTLEHALETTLIRVVSWEFGTWDSVRGGYEDVWHRAWTKTHSQHWISIIPKLRHERAQRTAFTGRREARVFTFEHRWRAARDARRSPST